MATDPIIKDHQLWIGFVQPEGLVVSPHALKNAQAVLSRNVSLQQEILRRHTAPDFDSHLRLRDFPAFTREFWEWRESDLTTPPDDLSARLPEYGETLRPTWVVRGGANKGSEAQPEHLILVEDLPWGTDFDKAGPQSEERRWHASPQARFERLLRETGVAIGLLISPERIRLVYAPKGESSGHVTFPIHQMTMVPNWPMLAALHLLLHSDRLFIGPENQRLPAILEASRRYQNEVSIRLAGQVLRALNELVRGFQEADRAAHGGILGEALRHDPSHIYGGMLTTLMRMVFVLYAEDRSLMGSDETWLQDYSISGLYERLRADAGQYPDTMDSRYGAWAQIVTLTRLLYDGGGHGSWRLPPRHGGLFDPDAYPFLENRPWESKRRTANLIEPPLVSDGIIFRILQDLLYLDGERISYRALDVEQIGSVYEAMMGFTVETAHGISIGLGSDHLVINLEELLAKNAADRPKWLKESASSEVTGKAIEQLKSASSVDELLAGLRRRISKLYLDQNSNPVTVPAGGIYLQPTEERRRSGSHYTPRSLTQPIVKTTLDPVLTQLGDNPTPEQILGLKVCDPAMGSGAFLVEACRYLGEKLEKAWVAHGQMPPIPADQDPLLHARRIVAQRCLYGVDKNPFAVNLAKLSLWLATFAKDHPFTFVDHTLRCGDSLVGLTAHQIEAFHWQPKEEGALLRDLPSRLRHILNERARIIEADEATPYETLAQRLAVTEEREMTDLRLAGDLTVAAFFAADKPKERETLRRALAEKFRRAQERVTDLGLEEELQRTVQTLKTGPKGVAPFHWELEFPEVFGRENPGFDGIVGNPPFTGGKIMPGVLGPNYCNLVKTLTTEAKGAADLVAYFFRRSFVILGNGGCFGLLATNSLAQTVSRRVGLEPILRAGGRIYEVWRDIPWPGEAAVVVTRIHIRKGVPTRCVLDGRAVEMIPATLARGADVSTARRLSHPVPYSSGVVLYCDSFILEPSQVAEFSPSNPGLRNWLRKYVNGKILNETPLSESGLTVADFGEKPRAMIEGCDDFLQWLVPRVLAERTNQTRQVHETRPWLHWDKRMAFFATARRNREVLVCATPSTYLAFRFVESEKFFMQDIVVFAEERPGFFAIMQSRVHEAWAYATAGTMKKDIRYSTSNAFVTFPFADEMIDVPAVASAGTRYHASREAFMKASEVGLTSTYTRFHDPDEHDPEIAKLRELHVVMDRAVIDAYGWSDIPTDCEFLLDYEIDEDEWGNKKKPWRYRWPDEVRDEVLARLLELNHTRAEEEAQSAAPVLATIPATNRGRKCGKNLPAPAQAILSYEESTE